MYYSRTKKAVLNTSTSLVLGVVTAICGLILPRLILSHFGSSYNGIVSSISQFISCISLLQSGIGGATKAALYKPLAENDCHKISEVVNSTKSFLRKIALIFVVSVFIFAAVYPLFFAKEFDWLFVFTLILILSFSTFVQYYFNLTYQMLIEADQSQYIIFLTRIATVILNTLIASILIVSGRSIHAVKLFSAMVSIIPPIFYIAYIKKHYHIDNTVPVNTSVISQRWNAFGHQFASFINTNTDVILTTIFLGLKEVSVYTVFFAVANGIGTIIHSFSSGISSAFGNIIAKDEYSTLKTRYEQFELIVVLISTVLLSITAFMYIPFVTMYTNQVTDVNYIRPMFGLLFCISAYITSISTPVMAIIQAAGKFKETMSIAISEAVINIVLSIIFINIIGLNGIIIGTITAGVYKLFMYNLYVSKNILPTLCSLTKKILMTVAVSGISAFVCSFLPLSSITTWSTWLLWACVVSIIVAVITLIIAFIMFRSTLFEVINVFISVFFKRQGMG